MTSEAAPARAVAGAGPVPAPRARSRHWSRLALAGALAGVAGLLVVEEEIHDVPGFLVAGPALLWLTLLWWALGIATAALLLAAAPRRLAIGLVLGAALATQAVGIAHGPRLSDDLYRYAWDGRVQAAGIDPYRYSPLEPELVPLRDDWLFPNSAGCTADDPQPRCTRLNYPRAHTIYPPVAEAYFTAVHVLPGPPREHKIQLYASLLSLGLVVLLMRALAARGHDPRHAAFYALSPLAGIDAGSDAHVDVLGALLALGAIMVLGLASRDGPLPGAARVVGDRSRAPDRPGAGGLIARVRQRMPGGDGPGRAGSPGRRWVWLAGTLIGAAVAVKLYPALLLPAAMRRRPVSLLASAAAAVALVYLPHVLAVGTGVLGFLPQYLQVEGYGQGSRFLLLAGVGLHGTAARVVAVGVLGVVALAVLCSDPRRVPVERAAVWVVGTAYLVATPAQPWYGVLLVMLAVLAARPEWLAVPAAAYVLYISLFTDVPGDAWTLRVSAYGTAALIVLGATAARALSRPVAGRGFRPAGTGRQSPVPATAARPSRPDTGPRPGHRSPRGG